MPNLVTLLYYFWKLFLSSAMEILKEIQIQSMAFVFTGLRMAGNIPKILRPGSSVEMKLREHPPDCLSDPMLGRHLYLKIKGTKYHYVESGSRRHDMILCLHDFSDFWYGWRKQLRGLSGSYWVVAPDLKGFGDSEKPFLATNYKDDVILEELRLFIEILQDSSERKVVIIGHGLGGHIAWKLLERYPNLFSKFVSISTPHPNVWLKNMMKSWRSVFENRWFYECRVPFLPERALLGNDLEVIDKRFKKSGSVMDLSSYSNFDKEAYKYTFSRREDWQGPVNYFRNLPLTQTSCKGVEKQVVDIDTLFLVGNLDPKVSLEMVSQSAEYVSRFAVKIVNMAGNAPHQEQPDSVNQMIAQFVKGSKCADRKTKSCSNQTNINLRSLQNWTWSLTNLITGDMSYMSKWSSMIKLVK
ncbi:epoxide hydrolase 4 isoform X2 [Eurytemora carolleeae]|uniref:epoxide hydrolase 4 isoform X2 n=1 Tax=Eurytemora carolleeae TaxID=1294199 RepID=UPI000C78E8D6|nr:epoxide hydrolase 4 isoform X2 [Eurytemora carolleeae]|eukprot:XP_023345310.1 epoxide hydrolase 4-like isoform X2 [Eurytemora affinis]